MGRRPKARLAKWVKMRYASPYLNSVQQVATPTPTMPAERPGRRKENFGEKHRDLPAPCSCSRARPCPGSGDSCVDLARSNLAVSGSCADQGEMESDRRQGEAG